MRAWPGNTCAATPITARSGPAGSAWHLSPAGGCEVAEDPDLDGRAAHPQWLASADGLLKVRAARALHVDAQPFDLWRIPGRKRLTLDGVDLALIVDVGGRRMRLALSGDLAHGDSYASTVPLRPGLRRELDSFYAQARALEGHAPQPAQAQLATRAALMHLRALQALDASQAGASHRAIAQALFGLEAVASRWHEDSEMRAQVRHLLRRAKDWMNGGYLALAGIAPAAAKQPGDERVR